MILKLSDFHNKSIMDYLKNLREKRNNSKDQSVILYLNEREEEVKILSVDLIERVKKKEDGAFDDLMEIKDIRNFIYHYSYHIRNYFKRFFTLDRVVHEMRYQIFFHIVFNYRIYNVPHEISLLINSMRMWIKQRVSKNLLMSGSNENDEQLNEELVLVSRDSEDIVMIKDLIERCLNEREKSVFVLRFFDGYKLMDISEKLSIPTATVQRIYNKTLKKIEAEIKGKADKH